MRAYLVLAPNLLSGTRLALIPVLWALALRGDTWAVGIGLVAAGITDVLDGHLARRLNATTAAGAALDSLADNLLIPSGVAWLVMLRLDVVVRFALPLAVWFALYVAFITLGLAKFGRFGNLHLYSAKVSAVGMYAFVVGCFLTSDMPDLFGWLAFAAAVVAVVEGLLCQILSDDIDETAGSLLRVLRRARPPASDRPRRSARDRPTSRPGASRATERPVGEGTGPGRVA